MTIQFHSKKWLLLDLVQGALDLITVREKQASLFVRATSLSVMSVKVVMHTWLQGRSVKE